MKTRNWTEGEAHVFHLEWLVEEMRREARKEMSALWASRFSGPSPEEVELQQAADVLGLSEDAHRNARARRWRCGLLFRWGSCWVGAHWSPYNRRWCINPVPCVTLWITLPGGNTP